MNKTLIIASLNKIANKLDEASLYKEASSLTNVMKRIALLDHLERDDELSEEEQTELENFKRTQGSEFKEKLSPLVQSLLRDTPSQEKKIEKIGWLAYFFSVADFNIQEHKEKLRNLGGSPTLTMIEAIEELAKENNVYKHTIVEALRQIHDEYKKSI